MMSCEKTYWYLRSLTIFKSQVTQVKPKYCHSLAKICSCSCMYNIIDDDNIIILCTRIIAWRTPQHADVWISRRRRRQRQQQNNIITISTVRRMYIILASKKIFHTGHGTCCVRVRACVCSCVRACVRARTYLYL